MSQVSDLVRDSRLDTRIQADVTCHRLHETDPTGRERAVVRKEYWKRVKRIGSGGFGNVWLEKCVKGEKDLGWRALKEIPMPITTRSGNDYTRELEALAKFSQPRYVRCFVRSLGWYENGSSICIAMEYFPLGDLHHYLASVPPVPEVDAQTIAHQLLEGLSILHDNGFAHRDLKPGNILIQSKSPWWVKIGDFGISKRVEEGREASSTVKGTLGYMAPELLSFVDKSECCTDAHSASCASDIWALGEMVFQMLTKEGIFANLGLLHTYTRDAAIFPATALYQAGLSDECVGLIRRLVQPSPKTRLRADEAINHDWFASHRSSSPRALSVSSDGFSDIEVTTSFARTKSFAKTNNFAEPSGAWSARFPNEEPATIAFGSANSQEGHSGQRDGYYGSFGLQNSTNVEPRAQQAGFSTAPSVPGRFEQSSPTPIRYNDDRNASMPTSERSASMGASTYPPPQSVSGPSYAQQQNSGQPSPAWDTLDRSYRQQKQQQQQQQQQASPDPSSVPRYQSHGYQYRDMSEPATWTDPSLAQHHDQRQQAQMRSFSSEFDASGRPAVASNFDAYGRPVPRAALNQSVSAHIDVNQQTQDAYVQEAWQQQREHNPSNRIIGQSRKPVPPALPPRGYTSPTPASPEYYQPATNELRSSTSTSISQVESRLSDLSMNSSPPLSNSNVIMQKAVAMFTLPSTQNGDLALTNGESITITQRTENLQDYWIGFTADGRVGRFPGYAVWLPSTDSGLAQSESIKIHNTPNDTAQLNSLENKAAPPGYSQTITSKHDDAEHESGWNDGTESGKRLCKCCALPPPDPSDTFELVQDHQGLKRLFRGNVVLDLAHKSAYISALRSSTCPPAKEFTWFRYTVITDDPEDFPNKDYSLRPSLYVPPRPVEILIAIKLTTWPNLASFSNFLNSLFKEIARMVTYQQYEDHIGSDPWKSIVVAIISPVKLDARQTAFLEALGFPVKFTISNDEGQPLSFVDDEGSVVGDLIREGQGVQSVGEWTVKAQLFETTTNKYVKLSSGGNVVGSEDALCPLQLCFLDDDVDEADWADHIHDVLESSISLEFDLDESHPVPELPRDTLWRGWLLAQRSLRAEESSDAVLSTRVNLGSGKSFAGLLSSAFKKSMPFKSRKAELKLFEKFYTADKLLWQSTDYAGQGIDTEEIPQADRTFWFWDLFGTGKLTFTSRGEEVNLLITEYTIMMMESKYLMIHAQPEAHNDDDEFPWYWWGFDDKFECEKWYRKIIELRDCAVAFSNPDSFPNGVYRK